MINIADLPDTIRSEMEEAGYTGSATPEEWFQRWLEWNGIIGYEDSILAAVRSLGLAAS